MIVNEGRIILLDFQDSALEACYWILFENNATITAATVFADLTQPVWSSYAPVVVGTLPGATIVGGRAQKVPGTPPVFTNSSGSDQTIYGWALVNAAQDKVISATNIGAVVIPAGLSFVISAGITDTQE